MRGFRTLIALSLCAMSPAALAQTAESATAVAPSMPPAVTTLPQPSPQALQPIPATPAIPNAVPAVTTTASPSGVTTTTTVTPNTVTPTPSLTQQQQNQAAVQAILGEQVRAIAPPVAPSALNASDLLARGTVVTPAAKEVVLVKKGAAASTDRAVFLAADRAFTEGQYSTAVDLYDRILRRSPSNKTALYGKALALHKAGRTDEALKIYDRLSLLDPTNVNATANYMSLLKQKDPQRALSRLQNLEQQYPNRPALQGQVGLAYAEMNDTPNAVKAFTRAAMLDPNNPVYAFNLGALYDKLGNDNKAGEYYRSALAVAGNNPQNAKNIPQDAIRERLQELND